MQVSCSDLDIVEWWKRRIGIKGTRGHALELEKEDVSEIVGNISSHAEW